MGTLALLVARDDRVNLTWADGAAEPPNVLRVLVASSYRWLGMLLGVAVPAAVRVLNRQS